MTALIALVLATGLAGAGVSLATELAAIGVDGPGLGLWLVALALAWFVLDLRHRLAEVAGVAIVVAVFAWMTSQLTSLAGVLPLVAAVAGASVAALLPWRMGGSAFWIARSTLVAGVVLAGLPGVALSPIGLHWLVAGGFALPIGCAMLSWHRKRRQRSTVCTTSE